MATRLSAIRAQLRKQVAAVEDMMELEPKRSAGGQFTNKYPFHKTRVNGKFVVPLDRNDPEFRNSYNRLRAAAYAYFKRTDRKFSCRQVSTGVEVKRIQ